jgi:hypothetical protein
MKAIRVGVPAVIIGALALTAGGPAFASSTTQVPVQPAGNSAGFGDVVAVSVTDGWAVGGNGNGLVERYNGTKWSVVASPDLLDHGNPNNFAGLSGVDATSANNAIAVGSSTAFNGAGATAVALRWNGTAWSRATVAKPTGATSQLRAVKAFSASDAWAVGATGSISLGQTLAMHFDGTSWTQSPTPSPGTRDNILTSVAGSAPNDVWAVGYFLNLPYGNRLRQPLILHWNGTTWSQVPAPAPAAGQTTFVYDVSVSSPTDAWAVGYTSSVALGVSAYVVHWDGSAWTLAPVPPLQVLNTVSARSATDVWAAGADASGAAQLAHWNGSGWSLTPVTVTGGIGVPSISSIRVVDADTEWAVGSQGDSTTGQWSPIALRVTG